MKISHQTYNLEDFVKSLERPRRVFLMIKSGKPIDMVIDQLIGLWMKVTS